MEKKKWNKVVQKAYHMLIEKDKYAYFYGAKGQVLTDALMDSLIAAYPSYFNSRYTKLQLDAIKTFSRGRIGYDCSGLITALTGDNTYSTAQFEKCTHKSTDLAKGLCGQLLYKDKGGRHIGIDVGFGLCIDIGVEGQSLRLRRIEGSGFELTGRSPFIDYEGASAY